MKTPFRLAITAAAVFAVATAGGQAFAYFAASGSGTGSGTVNTTMQVIVTTANLTGPGKSLLPGTSRTIDAVVTNDNPMPATLESVNVGTLQSSSLLCSAANLTVTPPAPLSAIPVPAEGSASVPITVTLSAAAPNDCQGATFTIPLTVQVRS